MRDPSLDGGLASGNLPLSGRNHHAHDDLVHLAALNSGSAQGFLDGQPAQIHGFQRLQAAAEFAEWSAGRADDDHISH